jgi:LPS export ABC transporter protein LptC
MWKKKLIQIFLIILVLIILIFFFFNFFSKDDDKIKLNNKIINNEIVEDEIKEVNYTSKDKKGNLYNIVAKKALINNNDKELIKLDTVKAIYNFDEFNKLFLYSDSADYDINNNITFFYNNIRIVYNNELIKCDELQLNLLKNYMILEKNIIYESINIKLTADQLKIDLLDNTSLMKMFNEGDKIKILKKNVSN